MKKENTTPREIAQIESEIAELEKFASEKRRPKATSAEIKRLKSTLQKVYVECKKKVMDYEVDNYTTLVFLRSTNGFYKIFGHSLLFYVSDVVPKLDLSVNVYSDGDHDAKSETGVVSIANLLELEKSFKKLGIKKAKATDKTGNVLIYDLPWKYTEKDVERLVEQNNIKKRRFNHVVMAENINPTLFVNLNDLTKACYENVRRLEPVARDTMGKMVIEACTEMVRCYIEMGNGRIKESAGLEHIKRLLNKIKAQAMILSDLRLWNARTYARIGDIIIKTQDILDMQLKSE